MFDKLLRWFIEKVLRIEIIEEELTVQATTWGPITYYIKGNKKEHKDER